MGCAQKAGEVLELRSEGPRGCSAGTDCRGEGRELGRFPGTEPALGRWPWGRGEGGTSLGTLQDRCKVGHL